MADLADAGIAHALIAPAKTPAPGQLTGTAWTRYAEAGIRIAIEARFGRLREVRPGRQCAGAEYLGLLEGAQDFALFWRSQPWDHAPGIVLVRAAGGHAAYLDGTPYRPGARRFGLLVARSPAIWSQVREALVEGIPDPEGFLRREASTY